MILDEESLGLFVERYDIAGVEAYKGTCQVLPMIVVYDKCPIKTYKSLVKEVKSLFEEIQNSS